MSEMKNTLDIIKSRLNITVKKRLVTQMFMSALFMFNQKVEKAKSVI